MTVKQNVADLLTNKQGSFLSGEFIARKLGVTRAAVWKSINSLKADGFDIEAVNNKGYRLNSEDDTLCVSGINKYLKYADEMRINIFDVLESTNLAVVSKHAEDEGLAIVAREQTAGLAKNGKHFYSPKDTGIYFSILLKPDFSVETLPVISKIAAIAVCRVINSIGCGNAVIENVNDIYYDGHKVCGILSQASILVEESKIEYDICGIGINIYPIDISKPDEEHVYCGNIMKTTKGGIKNYLLAETLNCFWSIYKEMNKNKINAEYLTYKS